MYCCAVLVSQVIGHVLVHEARRVKRLRLEANGLVITPLNLPNKTYSVREVCWWPKHTHPPPSLSVLLLISDMPPPLKHRRGPTLIGENNSHLDTLRSNNRT